MQLGCSPRGAKSEMLSYSQLKETTRTKVVVSARQLLIAVWRVPKFRPEVASDFASSQSIRILLTPCCPSGFLM